MSTRIILAEDHRITREGLLNMLKVRPEMKVIGEAKNGREAVRLARELTPDLVIMDVRLGKYNGFDLLQDIRNTYNNLPVIVCTAYPPFKYDLKSIAADYYAIKSSDLSELKSLIKMTLEGGRSLPSSVSKKKVQRSESMRVGRTKVY